MGTGTPEPGALTIRRARREDLAAVVRLLAADPLGAKREAAVGPLPEAYARAFEAIDGDPNNELVVGVRGGAVIGVLQITFIPGLTYTGGWRAQIEGVRIAEEARAKGAGRALIEWVIERARGRACRLVQLTTDKTRPDAVGFYERLGFVASHEGMKLDLARAR